MTFSDIGLARDTLSAGSMAWAADWPRDCRPGTLDATTALAKYPDGLVPSGACLGIITANKRYGPYGGTSEEVQTLTEGGSGLTSFTITFSGQTTSSIDDDATAAEVQAALEALSNIAPGDVVVTGGPLGTGPMTVTFGGAYVNTNVAQMTTTPTGGTGTVTVATATAGGADIANDGRETGVGFLVGDKLVRAGQNVPISVYYAGRVFEDRLPANSGFDPAAKVELTPKITFDRIGA